MAPPQKTGLQHDALFYDDDEVLASSAVAFVREGLAHGQRVFLSCSGHPVSPLLTALFGDEPGVRFTVRDRSSRPARVLDEFRRAMDAGLRSGVPGYRAMGLTDIEDSEVDWREWLRFEAVANLAFARYPLQTMCPWDLRTLSDDRAAAFGATHRGLVGPQGRTSNRTYVDPAELVTRREHRPGPDPVQSGVPHLELDTGPDLRRLDVELYPPALSCDLSRLKVDDFVKAVGSVVVNAWTHGRGPVRLRLWKQPRKLLCTVTDHGPGIADPFVGYARPAPPSPGEPVATGGYGLWAARQLCDTLDYASTTDGFTVRLVSHD